ncbi:MAG: protein kinase [Polyangia bacterium]
MSDAAHSEAVLAPGTQVDHFQVMRLVGRGGMGEVYLARDTLLGRKVALKLVHPEALGDEQARQRFLYEARVTARFSHPHIVTIFAVGDHEGSPYVALEFLEGQNLRERMREGRLGVKESVRIGLAIAEALAEAHRAGVLHRDLKPENVLVPPDGRLRVVDFGLAKTISVEDDEDEAHSRTLPHGATIAAARDPERPFQTDASSFAGTPSYMSPEQWHRRECDAGTDVWALGVILFELISGERPFRGKSVIAIGAEVCLPGPSPALERREGVPDDLRELVDRCLEKNPERRPSTGEVVETLEQLVGQGRTSLELESGPFRGLLPFTERHADYFFGRENEVLEFLERLRHRPVLPVVGASGAGKSSFVQAGVIPRLREQARWIALTVRPGSRPFQALAFRIASGEEQPSRNGSAPSIGGDPSGASRDLESERSQADEIYESPGRLSLALQRIADEQRARVLLLVDQIEEIYTQVDDPEVRRRFMEAVCSAADDPRGPVRVVFTLRDDFVVRLSEVESARRALGRSTVLRTPGSEALLEILTRPLRRVGYRWEDESLVERMIDAVGGEPSSLPLLQFACGQLWEKRDLNTRMITAAAYEQIGGVEGALARRADAVVDALTPAQLDTVQQLLLRLVTGERTRRTVPLANLVEELGREVEEVIDRLVDERILVTRKGDSGRGSGVELVHESLIGNWDRLSRWIDASRENLVFLAEVGQAAELWRRRQKRAEEVWQGGALHDALRRAARLPTAPALVLALMYREASEQRNAAVTQRERAVTGRAEALRDGARAASDEGDPLEARAKLRMSLEARDSVQARALWWRLAADPLLWRADNYQIIDIDWAADGERLGVVLGGPLGIIDARTGEMIDSKQGDRMLYTLDFSADGRRLIGAGSDVAVWDAVSGAELFGFELDDAPYSKSIETSADGERLVAAVASGGIRVWSMSDGQLERAISTDAKRIALSADGERVAAVGSDRSARVWSASSGELLRELEGLESSALDIAISPDGGRIAVSEPDGRILIWEGEATTPTRIVTAHRGKARRVVFHPDGRRLATTGADGVVALWDASDGTRLKTFCRDLPDPAALAFDREGKRLAAGGADGELRAWRVGLGSRQDEPGGHRGIWLTAAFDPTGELLASGDRNHPEILLWDVESGASRGRLAGHEGGIRALSFHPGGRLLASAGADGAVRIWNHRDGEPVRALLGHAGAASAVAYGPDGTLASGDESGVLRLWNPEDGSLRAEVPAHEQAIAQLAFDPSGGELASASPDGSILLWNPRNGASRGSVHRAGRSGLLGVDYSPDGRFLAHGREDKSLLVVDRRSKKPHSSYRVGGRFRAPFEMIDFDPRGELVGASPGGCLTGFKDDREYATVEMHLLDGKRLTLTERAVTFDVGEGRIFVADDERIVEYDNSGAEIASHPVDGVVSGIAPTRSGLAIGYFDGNIELVSLEGDSPTSRRLRDSPEIAVEITEPGPGEILIATSATGSVGFWHTRTGELLHRVELNGRPTIVHREGSRLYLASAIGDWRVLDLSVFGRDYCELLEEVWSSVPVVWESGHPLVREPPAEHRCLARR